MQSKTILIVLTNIATTYIITTNDKYTAVIKATVSKAEVNVSSFTLVMCETYDLLVYSGASTSDMKVNSVDNKLL